MSTDLQKLLDKTKTAVFLGSNAAFLGSIMCQIEEFIWDTEIDTASTNGRNLRWNPDWFLGLPEETRKTVLLHELWHIGRLHMIRGIGKDPEIWNEACDYVINNHLDIDGYVFHGTTPLLEHKYDGMVEEQIYELLLQNQHPNPKPNSLRGDLVIDQAIDPKQLISQVITATHQAKLAGDAGSIPGDVSQILDEFLNPVLPWELLLRRFMEELTNEEQTWAKRSRRHPDIYMPGWGKTEGGLSHLAYFLDVSGSVSDHDILRFNSEVKYIKEELNPERLTLVLFDTRIQEVIDFYEDDPFDKVVVTGRGGTSLEPVEKWIRKNKPTAAVIFSDLECHPMDNPGIPVLWIVIPGNGFKPDFGEVIDLK